MKRIKIVGLCLVAAFAFSALIASGASAATYYRCSAQKKGEYTESNCATKSAKAHKGTFEITTGRKFTATTGTATLKTPAFGPNNVVCSSSTATGELTGPKTGFETATFSGCEVLGFKCQSEGPNSTPSGKTGVIITSKLDSTLLGAGEKGKGFVGAKVEPGEVWTELVASGEHGPFSSEFYCEGAAALRTHQDPAEGSDLSGVDTPINAAPSTTGTTEFGEGKGESALLSETFSEEHFGGWGPPGGAPSSENTTGTVTYETGIEIKG